MADPYQLQRFVDAQAPLYDRVRAELAAGRKQSHWMWFVFPQISGLGQSEISRRYAIAGRTEADAYLRHEVLGARLRECTALVNQVDNRSAHAIFGSPDDMKFRSCMTLFAAVAEDDSVFTAALRKFFSGNADQATLSRLEA